MKENCKKLNKRNDHVTSKQRHTQQLTDGICLCHCHSQNTPSVRPAIHPKVAATTYYAAATGGRLNHTLNLDLHVATIILI